MIKYFTIEDLLKHYLQKKFHILYERHVLLSSWLERLGVDPDIAAQDACRIEHVISSESFEALKKHIK